MSMSEFERQENNWEEEFSSLLIQGQSTPVDFTEEDLAFAAELNALFSPEEENLPPYYVQTLLDVDDQRFEPVERGFEHKTSARVFRRLKLRRRLFYAHTSPLSALSSGIGDPSMRRPVLALLTAFMALMLFTVAFTGGSFASGVAILLHGTHKGGVYLADKYPVGMIQRNWQNVPDPAVKDISLLTAQQEMHFPVYWPGYTPSHYSLEHINLYAGLDQQWADGPMLEFEFSLPPSSEAPKGTGEVWVREFKPKEDVLQLVAKSASVPIDMDNSGKALAIYVNGQWDPRGRNTPQWVSGGRSELIYELNGVVFWIVGDQRDGVGEQELMKVAQGLQITSFAQGVRVVGQSIFVTQMSGNDIQGPFSNDVIVLFPDNGANGPYYVSENPYQPPAGSNSNSNAPPK